MRKYDIKRIKQDIKTAEAQGLRNALERFGTVREYGSGYRLILLGAEKVGPLCANDGTQFIGLEPGKRDFITQCKGANLHLSALYMLRTHIRGHLHARKVWLPTLGAPVPGKPQWVLQEMDMNLQELLLGNLLKQYELPETLVRAPHLPPGESHQGDVQGDSQAGAQGTSPQATF